MRRRDLITISCWGAVALPFVATAETPAMPVIGYLSDQPPEGAEETLAAFRKGLEEQGFVEGRNLTIEWRWGRGDYAHVPDMAADLVKRYVSLIVASGSPVSTRASLAATSTIPIVSVFGGDPTVDYSGRVASINHPGGNLTGAALFTGSTNILDGKRIDLLKMLLPRMQTLGILTGALAPVSQAQLEEEQKLAEARALRVKMAHAETQDDFAAVFAFFGKERVDAILESPNAMFHARRASLIPLAAQYRIPTIWEWPDFVQGGGLMSYGSLVTDTLHQMGVYAGLILKGEKPGDLPIVLPNRYHLAINLKTAKTLDLAIPPNLLAIADEVIE